ncbi:hypothetical protein FOC1_g10016222 [Fusarium oxysporum f. sp. cubense race 1]|uniref:Uncharacterized protein n=1 Tax=Fusarium oxysporum f. sp. cubense (strain race 1) TaxID=1229664 RepID=N4TQE2_FUSC1|nr:hypothetical protein FOC1_g10016222 [Fusarium oxysporum f. sp. cubense race 1]
MRILAWLGCRQNHFLYPLDFQLYAVPRMVGNTSPRVSRRLVKKKKKKPQPCNFLSIAMAMRRNL